MLSWLKTLADDANTVKGTLEQNLPNSNPQSLSDSSLIQQILNWGYALAGIAAVGLIVYGAWKYISAQGEPDRVRSATQTILFSTIGLVIVLLAAAITNFALMSVGSNIK